MLHIIDDVPFRWIENTRDELTMAVRESFAPGFVPTVVRCNSCGKTYTRQNYEDNVLRDAVTKDMFIEMTGGGYCPSCGEDEVEGYL